MKLNTLKDAFASVEYELAFRRARPDINVRLEVRVCSNMNVHTYTEVAYVKEGQGAYIGSSMDEATHILLSGDLHELTLKANTEIKKIDGKIVNFNKDDFLVFLLVTTEAVFIQSFAD